MRIEIHLALGIPILMLVCGTLYSAQEQLPRVLKHLRIRDAIFWYTVFGLSIVLGAVHYRTRE